jgi:8-oxo-dGTP pyrophosphatase MutT (NUDIX family)
MLWTYAEGYPGERRTVSAFFDLLGAWPDSLYRTHMPGHLTASAWIVAKEERSALLLHHRKLDKWLQPGGHVDGEEIPEQAALREVYEETGLTGLSPEPDLFDVDIHEIPARDETPDHLHYDMRFLVVLPRIVPPRRNHESHDVRWHPIDAIDELTTEESIRRMVRKSYASVGGVPDTE